MSKSKLFGILLLVLGVAALVVCILLAFAVGTKAVPVLLVTSIIVNSAGITLLRRGK